VFQFNNYELTNNRWNNNMQFQPVLPVSLTKDLNLITRPVIQVYNSVPYQTPSRVGARLPVHGRAADRGTELERPVPDHSGHSEAHQGNSLLGDAPHRGDAL
jgi:hypothetical protein